MPLRTGRKSGKTMRQGRTIELLAPARNIECGIEAIKHGADAVYIGADRFGARQAAGNTVADIAALCDFAHRYWAKVYVTVNTILRDDELADAEKLIWQLYEAGADALLVQDMAVLRMKLPPIALHASTQCDVRSIDKVRFLASCGFTRVVLARELSINEITAIHQACPDVELECFVHGALCVSYSGQCYASQYCFGRSANRGECAQFCRLKFDLTDAGGRTLLRGKHLLSLKDMNRIEYLEELMDAGVCSMKIEGRLKETSYVKNIAAAYSEAIDKVLEHRKEYVRASSGHSSAMFRPAPEKSFNRGFTDYFLHGRSGDIFQFDTPKSTGESMGLVSGVGRGWIRVNGGKTFHNGDGMCLVGRDGELQGYRVNRVSDGLVYLYLENGQMPMIRVGTEVFRNYDIEFEKLLSRESAVRKIRVSAVFSDTPDGFCLSLTDEDGVQADATAVWQKEEARSSQRQNIVTQISKLGNTEFEAADVRVETDTEWFVPSSLLSDMRRRAADSLAEKRAQCRLRPQPGAAVMPVHDYPVRELTYLGNVMNAQARTFYMDHGVESVADAFEKRQPAGVPVMYCRHCLRYALGACPKHRQNAVRLDEPLFLQSADGRRFRLQSDCAHCRMLVIPE